MKCIFCEKDVKVHANRRRCITCNDSMSYVVHYCLSCYKFYYSLGFNIESTLQKRVEEIRKENNI